MNRQTLFELLDGELEAEQVEQALDQVLADPELQKSWQKQHILRAAISDREVLGAGDMVDRVAAALQNEPTVMAPDNLPPQVDSGPKTMKLDKVVPIHSRSGRYLAYAAVAASLLAVVVFNFPQNLTDTPGIADTQPVLPASPAAEQELQSMIVQHGEFSGAAALNGLVAYAKVVNGSTSRISTGR